MIDGGAEILQDARRGRIGGGQRDRDLQHEVGGQVARRFHPSKDHQLAHVGDQHGAESELDRVPHVLDAVDELVDAAERGAEDSP